MNINIHANADWSKNFNLNFRTMSSDSYYLLFSNTAITYMINHLYTKVYLWYSPYSVDIIQSLLCQRVSKPHDNFTYGDWGSWNKRRQMLLYLSIHCFIWMLATLPLIIKEWTYHWQWNSDRFFIGSEILPWNEDFGMRTAYPDDNEWDISNDIPCYENTYTYPRPSYFIQAAKR